MLFDVFNIEEICLPDDFNSGNIDQLRFLYRNHLVEITRSLVGWYPRIIIRVDSVIFRSATLRLGTTQIECHATWWQQATEHLMQLDTDRQRNLVAIAKYDFGLPNL